MNLIALNTRDFNVPVNRWIASLSNGETVFEDIRPGQSSAWIRLAEYLKQNDLQISQMRLQAWSRDLAVLKYRGDNGHPQVSGYWHSKRMSKISAGGCEQEILDYGIGYAQEGKIHIAWICQSGLVEHEVRAYDPSRLGCIFNDDEVRLDYDRRHAAQCGEHAGRADAPE